MRCFMEDNLKKQKYFPVLLMVIGALLTIQGILGTPYEFFSGVKLASLFALGSMFGKIEEQGGNPLGKYMVIISGGMSLGLGCILLTPIFWPGRAASLPWLVAYGVTAVFAWGYLMGLLKNREKYSLAFKCFCLFLPVLLVSTLLAMYTYDGTLYAALLVSIYYLMMALLCIAHGIQQSERLVMNGGFFLLWALVTAFWLSVLFVLPDFTTIGLALLVVLVFNLFFTTMEGIKRK